VKKSNSKLGAFIFKSGIILMISSFVPWLMIPFVPWFPFLNSAYEKTAVAGGLLLLSEIMFWVGVPMAGKESWAIIKAGGWKQAPYKILEILKTKKVDAN
jgi:hypothetical protein